MTNDFTSHPEGARQGIAEHKRKIDDLVKEETSICDDAHDGQYDKSRLTEIYEEIERRQKEIDKLKGYLSE